jgi:type VI secretion system protein ImpM
MGDVITRTIGWYGKLPWVGDFVGRGLPWQRGWDEWLQRALPAAEAALGSTALRERLRGMAPWQLLLPAADGQGLAWCGIVVGSADRVGRVFPLLVAEALPQAVLDPLPLRRLQARMLGLSDWLWDASAFESLEQFEQGAAAWAAAEWPLQDVVADVVPGAVPGAVQDGAVDPPDTVAGLRRVHAGAAAFWWCTEPVPDARRPVAGPWPPADGWLLRLLDTAAYLMD